MKTKEAGNTSLMIAIDNNKKDIANMIIQKNAKLIDMQSNYGYTPLMNAIGLDNIQIIESLIKAGADITTLKNNNGDTAFMIASKKRTYSKKKKIIIDLLSSKISEKVAPLPPDDEIRPEIQRLPVHDEAPISENEIIYQRLDKAYDKIKKFYDNFQKNSLNYNTIVENITIKESNIQISTKQINDCGIDIKNIIDKCGHIDNFIINNYNKIYKELQNYNEQLISYENKLKEIQNTVSDSYFYFILEKTINNNRNYQRCKNEKNNCGYLQLRIDLDEKDVYKKIKIHGIFPSVPTEPTEPTEVKKKIFYDYDENIFKNNFINFFKNKSDYDTSIKKHLKDSKQQEPDFKKNTIWLAEAFMSIFVKFMSKNVENLESPKEYIKTYFESRENFIWGFINCFTIPENLSYILIFLFVLIIIIINGNFVKIIIDMKKNVVHII